MTNFGDDVRVCRMRRPQNQKAGPRPAISIERLTGRWVPGQSEAPPGRRSLLGLLGLLCLLRLFSLLRFLSHSILIWVLMDGNATRGMLGGGPTSQHPRNQSQQIRRPLPRAVTSLSLCYPQLLCVLARFRTKFGRSPSSDAPRAAPRGTTASGPAKVNKTPRCLAHPSRCVTKAGVACGLFIDSKPRWGLPARVESPLSAAAACCP